MYVKVTSLQIFSPAGLAIADGQEYRLLLPLGLLKGFGSPGKPVHRIVSMLQEIRRLLVNQTVSLMLTVDEFGHYSHSFNKVEFEKDYAYIMEKPVQIYFTVQVYNSFFIVCPFPTSRCSISTSIIQTTNSSIWNNRKYIFL